MYLGRGNPTSQATGMREKKLESSLGRDSWSPCSLGQAGAQKQY